MFVERGSIMRLMDRFRQWMIGRYGTDQLNIALLVVYLILSIVMSFVFSPILLLASYALFFLLFFRMFSKNIAKRSAENQKFMKIYGPIRNKLPGGKNRNNSSYYGNNPYNNSYGSSYARTTKKKSYGKPKTDKNHKIFQCGKCGQMIRVPKGKGKIVITCPSCKQEFIKRT